jgi:hypothetical protein
MKIPGSFRTYMGFETDERKKLVFDVSANINKGFENSAVGIFTEIELTFKPTNYLVFSLSPGISRSFEELQYVAQREINGSERYIFASIDQKTINTSFRINLNLSPDLTLQYWGQPFIATGKYYDHKYILDPMAGDYHDRFSTYTDNQITLLDDQYYVDEDANGTTDYSFENNDFNLQEFLSNLVVRWEYNPGSSVYFVWSQNRNNYNTNGDLNVMDDLGDLFDSSAEKPHNVFLIKFSYRFGIK